MSKDKTQPAAEEVVAEETLPETVETTEQVAEVVEAAPEVQAPVVTETAAPAAEAPAAVEEVQPAAEPEVVAAEPALPLTEFEKTIQNLKATGTSDQVALIGNLEQYIERMAPGKPNDGKSGSQNQLSLWNMMKNLLERAPDAQFRNLWSILLAYFHEFEASVFKESHVYRFTEHWAGSRRELDGFLQILNLVKVSANPKTRGETKKQVDLEKSIQSLSETGRKRLISFYSK